MKADRPRTHAGTRSRASVSVVRPRDRGVRGDRGAGAPIRATTSRHAADSGAKTRMVSRVRFEKYFRLYARARAEMTGRRFRALVALAAVVAMGGLLGVAAKSTWTWVTSTPRLAIKEIVVRSGPRVSAAEVRRLANLQEGDNVLAFRLRACVEAIQIHPWVKHASVMRELPNRVVIEVVEREPVAEASLGALYYVDDEGEIFKKVLPGETVDYPVFSGLTLKEAAEDKQAAAPRIALGLAVLAAAKDSMILPPAEISEVRLDPDGSAVVVRASDGMRIVLGRDGLPEKWRRAERAIVELGAEAAKVAELDLNYENRVTVRLREDYRAAADRPSEKL
jgi:cell division protein FtsQ